MTIPVFNHNGDERRARRIVYQGIAQCRKWAKNPRNDDPAKTYRAIADARRALRHPLMNNYLAVSP
ncbi:MAG TPA: hypothetical protein VJM50_23730 [Pyrinomonadaceae bacterium]|nr:hypothetical protein [Pyrinomonadaceae bacterium]